MVLKYKIIFKMDNFIENLILAVKERPLLYDMSHVDYKNNFKKTLAWTDISNEVGGDSGEAMKEKWKNLRDTYKKHKKSLQPSSGQATKKFKNWVWAHQMEFLDGSITMGTTESTSLTEYYAEWSTQPDIDPICTATQPSSDQISTSGTQQIDIGNCRRRRRVLDPTDKIIDYLKTRKPNEPTKPKLDNVDHLFLSYADTFKMLTPRRQAVLKLDLAKLFTEAELRNLDEKEKIIVPTPPTYSIASDSGQIII